MPKIDNEQFGRFLTQLRKEKGLTQKQLAEKLYVSDKAVSKWERGLSLPDISLLMPLSKILDVTTTELLSGKAIESHTQLTVEEVESLMTKTIVLSEEEQSKAKQSRKSLYLICVAAFALEISLFVLLGYSLENISGNIITVEMLMLCFGTYFTFFVKDSLPSYYDQNQIGFYNDGIFRMNIVGVNFNNKNWKHILKAFQKTVMIIFIAFPMLYLVINYFSPVLWESGQLFFTLGSVFTVLIPIYVVVNKYK